MEKTAVSDVDSTGWHESIESTDSIANFSPEGKDDRERRDGSISDSGIVLGSVEISGTDPFSQPIGDRTPPINLPSYYDYDYTRSGTWAPLEPQKPTHPQSRLALLQRDPAEEDPPMRFGGMQIRIPPPYEPSERGVELRQRWGSWSEMGQPRYVPHNSSFIPYSSPPSRAESPIYNSSPKDKFSPPAFASPSWERKFQAALSLSRGGASVARFRTEDRELNEISRRNQQYIEGNPIRIESERDINPFHIERRMTESSGTMSRNTCSLSPNLASLDLALRSMNVRGGATNVWYGNLPTTDHKTAMFSVKVFLGGVPWDTTEEMIRIAFRAFGNVRVEWPTVDGAANPPRGYAYVIFEMERQVKVMLSHCTYDARQGGSYYFPIPSRRLQSKEVQVIPWVISDSTYIRRGLNFPDYRLDVKKTVFVGALHGVMTAKALFQIMDDLFGDVVYAAIDTDKYKYPIGSGRVTFGNFGTFMAAVKMGYVEVKTAKFTKRLQLDPYLENATCSKCSVISALYFCRDVECFQYYCRSCWCSDHPPGSSKEVHKVIMRTERNTVMRNLFERI